MRRAGLTLVEVLVSIGFLAVIVMVVGTSMTGSLQLSRETRLNNQANQYAQAVLERYRTLWSSNAKVNQTGCSDRTPYECRLNPDLSALNSALPSSFDVAITRGEYGADGTAHSGGGVPDVRGVTVEVRHGGPTGKLRARLETRIARPEN